MGIEGIRCKGLTLGTTDAYQNIKGKTFKFKCFTASLVANLVLVLVKGYKGYTRKLIKSYLITFKNGKSVLIYIGENKLSTFI